MIGINAVARDFDQLLNDVRETLEFLEFGGGVNGWLPERPHFFEFGGQTTEKVVDGAGFVRLVLVVAEQLNESHEASCEVLDGLVGLHEAVAILLEVHILADRRVKVSGKASLAFSPGERRMGVDEGLQHPSASVGLLHERRNEFEPLSVLVLDELSQPDFEAREELMARLGVWVLLPDDLLDKAEDLGVIPLDVKPSRFNLALWARLDPITRRMKAHEGAAEGTGLSDTVAIAEQLVASECALIRRDDGDSSNGCYRGATRRRRRRRRHQEEKLLKLVKREKKENPRKKAVTFGKL
jgi:hypothetical protein